MARPTRGLRPDLPALCAQHGGGNGPVERGRDPATALTPAIAIKDRPPFATPGGGAGRCVEINEAMTELPIGKGCIRRDGQRVAILAFGSMVEPSLEVAETPGATVADMRFVKPLDTELVERLAESHDLLVTIEENMVAGGAGSGVSEHLHSAGIAVDLLQLGLPDRFIDHGKPAEQLAECGLDGDSIQQSIQERAGTARQWTPRGRSALLIPESAFQGRVVVLMSGKPVPHP